MSNLLYFPYINIPKTDWTIRALLYNDNIGTIVPTQYFFEPERFDPFMNEIIHNELINLINPIDVLDRPWSISEFFLNYLNDNPQIIDKRRQQFASTDGFNVHQNKYAYRSRPSKIHADKFDSNILYELSRIGLAEKDHDNWYIVETQTANELMTYLASIVASKIDYIPATDRIESQLINTRYINNEYVELRNRQYRRDLILKELIPFPKLIELNSLRRFKDRHNDLLKRFNNKVELIVLEPSITPESPLFQATLEELQVQKDELSARMNESHLGDIVYGAICGTVSAGIAFFTNPALGAGLGLLNAIHSARKIERPEDINDQTGLKYLALVEKRLRR